LLRFNYWAKNHLNIYKDVDSPKHLQVIIRDITYNHNKNIFLKNKNSRLLPKLRVKQQKNSFFLKKESKITILKKKI
jgi:hypothetical protein